MKRHLQRWGALYILLILFFGSLAGQYVFQVVYEKESIGKFMTGVFENWQSEWAQLFVQALLIQGLGHILYQKETEDQERMESKLDQLLEMMQPPRPAKIRRGA